MRETLFHFPEEPEEDLLFYKHDPRDSGRIAIGGANWRETDGGILVPEISDELKTTYEKRKPGPIMLGCGDKRSLSTESARIFMEQGHIDKVNDPYLRYFGGPYGVARITLLTIAMQYGPGALKEVAGTDFMEFTHAMAHRAERIEGVTLAQHSSLETELGQPTLNTELDFSTEVDCGYAKKFGVVSHLSANDPEVLRLAWAEWQALSGETIDPEIVEQAQVAHRQFANNFLGPNYEGFSITRGNFARLGLPTMVLDNMGDQSQKNFGIINLTTDEISSPHKAHDIGMPYYGDDATQLAEIAIKCLPDVPLDERLLMMNIVLDNRATLTVLGNGDPQALPLQRHGNMPEALAYLKSVRI